MRIIILLSIFIIGCNQNSNVRNFVQETKQLVKKTAPPQTKIYQYKSVEYTAYNKRDPFVNVLMKQEQVAVIAAPDKTYAPDLTRKRTLLENIELSKLLFTGFLQKDDLIWALVQDPLGIIHQVKRGDYIGKNYGIVTKIDEKSVIVEERFEDSRGNWTKRDVVLKVNSGGAK